MENFVIVAQIGAAPIRGDNSFGSSCVSSNIGKHPTHLRRH